MKAVKELKEGLNKQVEIYYRKPIRTASDVGEKVVIGVRGILESEGRNFIKVRDISDIVRDNQFGMHEQRGAEQLAPLWVYISKKNIGELYVKE